MLDRRWVTQGAMALANQMFFSGMSGFNDMVRAGFPQAHKAAISMGHYSGGLLVCSR